MRMLKLYACLKSYHHTPPALLSLYHTPPALLSLYHTPPALRATPSILEGEPSPCLPYV